MGNIGLFIGVAAGDRMCQPQRCWVGEPFNLVGGDIGPFNLAVRAARVSGVEGGGPEKGGLEKHVEDSVNEDDDCSAVRIMSEAICREGEAGRAQD
jgi:hypothetical protein